MGTGKTDKIIGQLWKRIEKALADVEPPVPNALPEAASAAAIEQLRADLPVPLPAFLEASLNCHDGTGGVELDELPVLYSVAAILRERKRLTKGVRGAESGTVPFRADCIPISGAGGEWTFIDAAPGCADGPLMISSTEDTDFGVSGDTFQSVLAEAAEKLEARAASPSTPGGVPWAQALLEALVESGDLDLAEDANRQKLADKIDERALSVAKRNFGGERAIAEAILSTLINAPAVEEVYADREAIIKAMRGSNVAGG